MRIFKSFRQLAVTSWQLAIVVCMLVVLTNACSPTKYVPKDEYLLRSVDIEIDNKNIRKEQLKTYVRQKPNKKIIGMRFHLWLYNRSKLDKKNRWNTWLRKNGEEPTLWQEALTDKSNEQLSLFLESKGYYYAAVSDTVTFRRKRADVLFRIETGWPYTISKVTYSVPDSVIKGLVLQDTLNTLLKPGVLFDVDILEKERKRIETNLKNTGYYSFAEDYISYNADTAHLNRKVSLELVIRSHTERTEDNQVVVMPYPLYNVRSLTVNASLSMRNLMDTTNNPGIDTDTLRQRGFEFIMPRRFPVKPSTIAQTLYVFPDSLFRISNVNQTYQHLSGLRNFKQVNIEFKEVPGQANFPVRELDCRINLLPFTRQSTEYNLEGTNSGGNLGGAVNFIYQNKSLFRHAEIFDMRLRGMLEAVRVKNETFQFNNTLELEAEASLNIPKFLLPFRSERFIRRFNPKTIFSILYNYQRRPDYIRSVFNTSFGYTWKGSDIIGHTIRPIDVSFVKLGSESKNFKEFLAKYPYLRNSYQSHMVVSSSYSFVRDVPQVRKENFFFVRANAETAGLLLNGLSKLAKKTEKPYEIAGNAFSQFLKTDIDMRYYYTINGNNRLVSRVFVGVGWPYGNSKAVATDSTGDQKSIVSMPFEKKYYSGGANSIRGWRLRTLGPGSFKDTSELAKGGYPNNTGDIKLEANIEYRFKLVWIIEGALFMDAGNVWDTHKDKDREGANFSFDRFYKEIALSGGIGLRFDVKYFILRLDLGMKLHDPSYPTGQRWIFKDKADRKQLLTKDDFCFSVDIAYPF